MLKNSENEMQDWVSAFNFSKDLNQLEADYQATHQQKMAKQLMADERLAEPLAQKIQANLEAQLDSNWVESLTGQIAKQLQTDLLEGSVLQSTLAELTKTAAQLQHDNIVMAMQLEQVLKQNRDLQLELSHQQFLAQDRQGLLQKLRLV
jgi:hypothetical protein